LNARRTLRGRDIAPEFPQHNGYGQIAEIAFQTEREMT
jgi:hypothetical protein